MIHRATSPKIDEQAIQRLADLYGALSDPTRLRIIAALTAGEMSVHAIALAASASESAVSHQLRLLRNLRLARARKQGRQVFYTLDDDHVADLFQRGLEHVKHG
jgi:ArsR family transcriptional regulator